MEEIEKIFDVCIVGIGISGLSAAISLLKESSRFESSNLQLVLCERDEHLHNRRQGYGLTLTNSVTGPLAKLNLLDKCLEQNCLSRSHFTFTSNGSIIGYYGRFAKAVESVDETKPAQQSGGSRGNIRIPREELRNLMLHELISLSNDPKSFSLPLNRPFFSSNDLLKNNQKDLKENSFVSSHQDTLDNNIELKWGYKFLFYEENDDYVTSYFEVSSAQDSHHHQKRIVSIKSAILLGGDGIKSKVRRCRDLVLNFSHSSGLNYLGITVIIGISEFYHPLLYEKGFYILDGMRRLFTMPYYTPKESSSSSSLSDQREKPLIMWQLSFSGLSVEESNRLKGLSFAELLLYAKDQVKGWFPPVENLFDATIQNEIWVTPLFDRNEMKMQSKYDPSYEIYHQKKIPVKPVVSKETEKEEIIIKSREETVLIASSDHSRSYEEKFLSFVLQRRNTRVTILGDSCHPMSMFKGQGANQSLEDGILFANWLLGDHKNNQGTSKKRKNPPTSDRVAKKKALNGLVEDIRNSVEPSEKGEEPTSVGSDLNNDKEQSGFSIKSMPKEIMYAKIRNFEREMISKTFPKVFASRKAAKDLHSMELQDVLSLNKDFHHFHDPVIEKFSSFQLFDYLYTINGIKDPETVFAILSECYQKNINATHYPENLEEKFQETLRKYL
jgi:2-polyprenyl-6-methoxyphenol hydroxylase-like FAD-dependent oxidoreductase